MSQTQTQRDKTMKTYVVYTCYLNVIGKVEAGSLKEALKTAKEHFSTRACSVVAKSNSHRVTG